MTPDATDGGSQFAIDVRPDRRRVHVAPVGELDILTAGRLERRVAELAGAGFGHVVVDLRSVGFLDSSGLRALLRLHRRSAADGWRLSLVQGPPNVQRLFELTGTLEVLPFEAPDRGSSG